VGGEVRLSDDVLSSMVDARKYTISVKATAFASCCSSSPQPHLVGAEKLVGGCSSKESSQNAPGEADFRTRIGAERDRGEVGIAAVKPVRSARESGSRYT
jgi:hypothetical protein